MGLFSSISISVLANVALIVLNNWQVSWYGLLVFPELSEEMKIAYPVINIMKYS